MRGVGVKGFVLVLLLVFFIMCSGFDACDARSGKHWRSRRGPSNSSLAKKKGKGKFGNGHSNHQRGGSSGSNPASKPPKSSSSKNPNPSSMQSTNPNPSTEKGYLAHSQVHSVMFNVLDFGAMGNGVADDTKAFQGAWAAACKAEAATVLVPLGYTYLVGPISFSGLYCQPNIIFQISTELNEKMPSIKPTALRFYGSYNVIVTSITIQNSPQCHLKFDNCEAVKVFNMTVSSPANSLNTDGMHLQNSRDGSIHHVNLACCDDCVSIQTGCSDVKIHSIHCGPGNGISIGGLGRDNTKACVSNITVEDIDINNTMTGIRIKTWQGGSGSVDRIKFTNIRMYEVQTPIMIDQFYCDRSNCKNQSSAVALSGISYASIRGTYTVKPVHFACSDIIPCSNISLTEIELKPIQERYHKYEPFCWQAFGQLYTPTTPSIFCLQNGKPISNHILSDHDTC